MRDRFNEQLEQLNVELIKMGALCEEAISAAAKALLGDRLLNGKSDQFYQGNATWGLVDTDAAAFEPLSRAYAIPKEDPSRGEVMERCLRDAAAAPMEILRLCCEAIDLHSEMLDKGSVMVLSDVGTGAVLCWGALYGAWLNVKVNTKSMADRPYAEAMNDEADGLVEQYWKRAEQIYESVMGRYT